MVMCDVMVRTNDLQLDFTFNQFMDIFAISQSNDTMTIYHSCDYLMLNLQ